MGTYLFRKEPLVLWLFLIGLTGTSLLLSNWNLPLTDLWKSYSMQVLIVFGYIKIWVVLQYFMELKLAPNYLKILSRGWVILSCVSVLATFHLF